jgi:hypothetical protein
VAKTPGWTGGRDLDRAAEARLAREPQHGLAARVHPAVLGRDRGLADPLLQAQDALVVALRDLGLDRVGRACGAGEAGQRERGDRAGGRAEESAS